MYTEVGVAVCLLVVSYMLQFIKDSALVEVAGLAPCRQRPFVMSVLLTEHRNWACG